MADTSNPNPIHNRKITFFVATGFHTQVRDALKGVICTKVAGFGESKDTWQFTFSGSMQEYAEIMKTIQNLESLTPAASEVKPGHDPVPPGKQLSIVPKDLDKEELDLPVFISNTESDLAILTPLTAARIKTVKGKCGKMNYFLVTDKGEDEAVIIDNAYNRSLDTGAPITVKDFGIINKLRELAGAVLGLNTTYAVQDYYKRAMIKSVKVSNIFSNHGGFLSYSTSGAPPIGEGVVVCVQAVDNLSRIGVDPYDD